MVVVEVVSYTTTFVSDDQVKWRRQAETEDKSNSLNVSKHLGSLEGAQWGKPGPGGSYWRQSALTGQGFHEKMVRTISQL